MSDLAAYGVGPLLAAADRDQSIAWGTLLGTLAWIVGGALAFALVVWLGIRTLHARRHAGPPQ